MTDHDLFTAATRQEKAKEEHAKQEQTRPEKSVRSNVPDLSVTELANGLKRTLEETYAHIRVRGELSGIKRAASGHLYGDIKDDNATINIVCWRGTMAKLSIQPEDGMEVIITGRVSSYAKSSRYQIIIESMDLAGEGALLKLLEERRKKLAAEGLFDAAHKKQLPYIPQRIGVITSPTGAVIRDIMHRLRDRFPSHVLIWPAIVQGDQAAAQIIKGIEGLHTLPNEQKPDVIIIARGGGSLEDLMAFNDEALIRAVAGAEIPIISAVGHETDTTLIDYAADLRAPTPTGAAEMVVPVRLQLQAHMQDIGTRLINGSTRILKERSYRLQSITGRLVHPMRMIEQKMQTLDLLSERLSGSLRDNLAVKKLRLEKTAARLISPTFLIREKAQRLSTLSNALPQAARRSLKEKQTLVLSTSRMLNSLSPKKVLKRGYSIVYDDQGHVISQSYALKDGSKITLEFADQDRVTITAQK